MNSNALKFPASENELFAIEPDIPTNLYVKKKLRFSHPFLVNIGERDDYGIFQYDGKCVKDCLQFSESLACGIKDYKETKSQWKEKITGLSFGCSTKKNVEIAQKVLEKYPNYNSETVNPDVGEAFAIVDLNPTKTYDYHAEFVIAKDGVDRITLSTLGGYEDAIQYGEIIHRGRAEFDIYSIHPNEDTFYNRWGEDYENPIVVVLTPKNPPTKRTRVSPTRRSSRSRIK